MGYLMEHLKSLRTYFFLSLALNLVLGGVLLKTCWHNPLPRHHEVFLQSRLPQNKLAAYRTIIEDGRAKQHHIMELERQRHRELLALLAAPTLDVEAFHKKAAEIVALKAQASMVMYQAVVQATATLTPQDRLAISDGIRQFRKAREARD